MRRSGISIRDVADWHNLLMAFHLAQRGKREKAEVRAFRMDLHKHLALLRENMLQERYFPGAFYSFHIRDPKPRIIHAPCFRDRVLHHALMRQTGPVIDRSLVFDTYACRNGKGSLAAVQRCQQYIIRYDWYAKIDMRSYFASIEHAVLKRLLRQRFKNSALLNLFDRVIEGFSVSPGRGLPIGALSSQYFANFYLSPLDRLLLETCRVQGMVRYMDDVVWFDKDKATVKSTLKQVSRFAQEHLKLVIKPNVQINRSNGGLTVCGYRVTRNGLRLSKRRRQLYADCRARWENAFEAGEISAGKLQNGYASALGITLHAQAAGWRNQQLQRCPMPLAVEAL